MLNIDNCTNSSRCVKCGHVRWVISKIPSIPNQDFPCVRLGLPLSKAEGNYQAPCRCEPTPACSRKLEKVEALGGSLSISAKASILRYAGMPRWKGRS